MSARCELKKLEPHRGYLAGRIDTLESDIVTAWKEMNVIATKKSTMHGSENIFNFNNIGYRMARSISLEFNDPIEFLQHRIHLNKSTLDQISKGTYVLREKRYRFSNKNSTMRELAEDIRLFEILEHKYMENAGLIAITEELKNVWIEQNETSARINELNKCIHEMCD